MVLMCVREAEATVGPVNGPTWHPASVWCVQRSFGARPFDTVLRVSGYLPERRDVEGRVSNGLSQAKGYPYLVTDDEHLDADGVEVYEKLIERSERTAGLFCCYLCGEEILERRRWHLDHVTPLIRRGPHSVDTLRRRVTCAT